MDTQFLSQHGGDPALCGLNLKPHRRPWSIADVYKVFGMLVRRDGTTKADMRKYYENHHVPLILGLAAPPDIYRRNYVLEDNDDGPDVITELVFHDQQAYEQWVATMYAPDSGVAEDEARFLNRGRTISYSVEESS